MAIAIHALGKCQILVNTGTSNALEVLGYSEDQVQIEERVFRHDVHSDELGGPEGPPINVQKLGEIHSVSFSLINFDLAVYKKVAAKVHGGTYGEEVQSGTLMAANAFRLLLKPLIIVGGAPTENEPRNYLAAFPFTGVQWRMGTKATAAPMVWECHQVSGVYFNDTIT